MKLSVWILGIVLIMQTSISLAGPATNTLDKINESNVFVEFDYFEDAEKSFAFDSVQALPDKKWTRVKAGNASLGFSQSQVWIRLQVNNTEINTENLILEIAYPLLDDVTFYALKPNGSIRTFETGDSKPFYPRDIDHPNMLLRFQLHAGENINIYARIKTNGSLILPVKVWQEHQFFEFAAQEQQFHFFYYGSLCAMIFINLAIFLTLREKLYLFYALSTTGYILFFITSRGFGQQLFLTDFPAIHNQLLLTSMPFLALFSLLFAREFLHTKILSPKLDMAIRCMIYFEYFNLIASVVLDYNSAVKLSAATAVVLFIILFLAGPICWRAKSRAGAFFTLAWLPLTIGFMATAGRTSGILQNNFFTEYAMQLGSGLEAFILTLALAYRLYQEKEGKIIAQTAIIENEQQRLVIQGQLSEAMMRDPITNLANRNRFEWLANNTFSEHPNESYVICVTRITRINELTRTLGLTNVERILTTVAGRMNHAMNNMPGVITTQSTKGDRDATFQLTGDTFGVLIEHAVFVNNVEKYQKFTQKLSLPVEIDSLSLEFDPRVGCAIYPTHGRDAAKLLRNALVAMESSHHSADQIGYYDNTLDIYNEGRLTLMSDLREALKNDEPELHYQPKLNLRDDVIVGLEALIRWHHPQQGFISPADFVPLAEQTGVIRKLTLWAIERAAKDLLSLRKIGYNGNMSINISAKDLLSEQLKDQIQDILNNYQVDPAKIYLELTETAAMDEPEAGLIALKQLTSLGLKISIDDFGAGYSSLSYLKKLPASEIKLDRSLIIDITESESSRLIVKASIDMAQGLGYRVVAEGIEDTETYQLLKQLGCDELQGFWLCKPKPLQEVCQWLLSRKSI